MKKITLLMIAFLGSIALQAQTACDQTQPGNAFQGGANIIVGANNGSFSTANDFIVTGGTTLFTVDQITASILTPDNIDLTSVEVIFYNDNSGVPGSQIGSTRTITPTSQTITGNYTLSNGAPVVLRDVVLDLTASEAFAGSGNATDDVTYWLELVAIPSSATGLLGWESVNSNNKTIIGNSLAFKNNSAPPNGTGGQWINDTNDQGDGLSDGVFAISGICVGEPLGVENPILAQISLYPNPIQGQLNITLPASVELETATMYDLLGQATKMTISENNTLNTANLAAGVYILELETSQGNLTKKVIKQ
ncbi:MAG TPA: T9SS type A sorting domain-containing protein [Flavobacteriaceae bacterium]|nr:T9SS type A sorting domain-containing protein [Flavobacteriaceae bacterium]